MVTTAHAHLQSAATYFDLTWGHTGPDGRAGAGASAGAGHGRPNATDNAPVLTPGTSPDMSCPVGTVQAFAFKGVKSTTSFVRPPWQTEGVPLSKAFSQGAASATLTEGVDTLTWRWGLAPNIVADPDFQTRVQYLHDLHTGSRGPVPFREFIKGFIPKVSAYVEGTLTPASLDQAWHRLVQAQEHFFGLEDPFVRQLGALAGVVCKATDATSAADTARILDHTAVEFATQIRQFSVRTTQRLRRSPMRADFDPTGGAPALQVCLAMSLPLGQRVPTPAGSAKAARQTGPKGAAGTGAATPSAPTNNGAPSAARTPAPAPARGSGADGGHPPRRRGSGPPVGRRPRAR
jgi:hypothetical protein